MPGDRKHPKTSIHALVYFQARKQAQETTLSLASNIRMLTQEHPTIHHGKITTAQPLLTQLTDYIGSSGKTGSSEKPIPGSIKALSHYVQMEWDARNHQYEITGDDSGGLWVIIESWANITDPEWETYLEHITTEWINNRQELAA